MEHDCCSYLMQEFKFYSDNIYQMYNLYQVMF